MANKNWCFLVSALLILSLLPVVLADIGPKPTMQIDVYYNGEPANSISAFWDSERQITTNELTINGEQSFIYSHSCAGNICTFGGFLPSKFSLSINYENKSFTSNELDRTSFNSFYKLDLSSDGSAKLTETTPIFKKDIFKSYILALILTTLIELIVWLIFLKIKKLDKKTLWWVLLANFISVTLIWFLVTPGKLFLNKFFTFFILIEVGVIIFEAIFVYLFSKRTISFWGCLITSIIANVSSVLIGGFLGSLISMLGIF